MRKKILLTAAIVAVSLFSACNMTEEQIDQALDMVEDSLKQENSSDKEGEGNADVGETDEKVNDKEDGSQGNEDVKMPEATNVPTSIPEPTATPTLEPTATPTPTPIHSCRKDGHETENAICKHCGNFDLGKRISKSYVYHGVEYSIHEQGAVIEEILEPIAQIHDTIEYDGTSYDIVKMCITGGALGNEKIADNPKLSIPYIPSTVLAVSIDIYSEEIKELVIPDSVRFITYDTRIMCDQLEKLIFPENLQIEGRVGEAGGSSTRRGKIRISSDNLKDLYLPDCFAEIMVYGENLTSLSMTDACQEVSIYDCKKLEKVEFRPIELNSEYDATLLHHLNVSGTEFRFSDSSLNGDLVVPTYVKSFEPVMAQSIIKVSGFDFSRTEKLESITLNLEGDFRRANKEEGVLMMKEISIPDTVKQLRLNLLGGVSIEKIVIPDTVESFVLETKDYTSGKLPKNYIGYLQLPSYVTDTEVLKKFLNIDYFDINGVIAVRDDCVDYFKLSFPEYTFVPAEY